MNSEYFNKVIMGAWVIVEKHSGDCTCSYCKSEREVDKKLRIVLPENKSRTSWRRVSYRTKDGGYLYFRSTLMRLCYFLGFDYCKWSNGYRLKILPAPIARTNSCSALLTYEKSGSTITRIKNVRSLFWRSMVVFTKSSNEICEGVSDED